MKCLAVVAHPDDEILGCGGTIARLVKEKNNVYVAILGEGITSRYQNIEQADQASVKKLQDCSRHVAKMLGIEDYFFYNLPDNRFDSYPLLDVVKIIERLIERLEPKVVYTHYGGDLNIDHAITFRAVLTATRPLEGNTVKELYTFETPSSSEWAFNQFSPRFSPNTFIDISHTLELKIKAMNAYESEVRNYPHPRSPEAIRAISQKWGSSVGIAAAEAFEMVRMIQ